MVMSRTLFGCLLPPARPQSHKENCIFFNALILNSDEVFSEMGHDQEAFREKMRKLFTNAQGEKLQEAIQELYSMLSQNPATEKMAHAIMSAARMSASLDGIADEDEVIMLRDRWLRRVNNAALSETDGSEAESTVTNSGPGFITLPIFISTNREQVGGHVKKFYGTGRSPDVKWAVMWLSLPDSLGYGETDCPTWRFSSKRSGAPRNKIVHMTTVPLAETCVYKLSETMRDLGEKECIIFTHGYNTTLANACKRMAQIAYTGHFRGPALVFSWPSNQSMASYTADEANVMWAIPDFLKTLKFIMTDLGMEKVHLLAHSMGSRLALYSLLRMHPSEMPPGAAKIGRVVLAAPDFDMGEFMYLSEEVTKRCERLTLYCSAEDQALHLSRSLHGGYARLGDFRGFVEMATNPKMKSLENMDAIDTTGTDNSWLRHAYVFDACGIIMDCCLVLRVGMPPHERSSLVLAKLPSGHVYWTFETTSSGMLRSSKVSRETLLKYGSSISNLTRRSTGSGKFLLKSSSENSLSQAEEKKEKVEEKKEDGPTLVVVDESQKQEDEEALAGELADVVKELDHDSHPLGGPKFSRLSSKRFMDEFGQGMLQSTSVGGTLHVEKEDPEEVGGSDVRLPSDAEVALNLDSKMVRTFSRSKTVAHRAKGPQMGRVMSLGGSHLLGKGRDRPGRQKDGGKVVADIQAKIDEAIGHQSKHG